MNIRGGILLGVVLTLVLGAGFVRAAPASPVTVVVPIPNEARTLNPDWQSDTGGYFPSSNLHCHLVVMDWGVTTGTPVYGDLAEKWSVDASGRAYTFQLRRAARWHDGRPVTSADVKYTFETIVQMRYPLRPYLADVKAITAPDPYTLVIELGAPDAAFLPMLGIASNWFGKILPRHLYEGKEWDKADVNSKPVGCGPFKYVEWVRGSHVTLEANPDYFLGKPKIDRLIFRVIPDSNVAYSEFRAGRFPFLGNEYNPPFAEIATQLMKDPSIQVVKTPSIYGRDLYINLRKPPLDQLKVRQAIAYALDRRAMNQLAFFGIWKPSYYAGIEAVSDFLNRKARFPEANRHRAEELLDEAGFRRGADGWRFRISLTNYPVADSRAIAEVVTQQLRRVGIDVRWEQYDTQTWLTRLNQGNFDMSTYFVRYGPAPDAYREHFVTGAPRNFTGYSNAEFDRIVEEARRARDLGQQRQLYARAQEILVRDMPYINLFEETKFSLVRKGWRGFPTQADSFGKAITWFGFRAVLPGE